MGLFTVLEGGYYTILDKINKFIPIYKITDPIDKIFPSIILFIILLVVIVALIFFSLIQYSAPSDATLLVVDDSPKEVPIAGANVLLRYGGVTIFEGKTNDFGEIKITLPEENISAYAEISKEGYSSFKGVINLTEGFDTKVNIPSTNIATDTNS